MREASSVAARTMMETASGLYFDFAAPDASAITIEDIARALGNTCRFGGHCTFYSVAEHATLVRRLVIGFRHPELALAALHHDSHEAYVGDIPTPLKRTLGDAYRTMVDQIDHAIGDALRIDPSLFAHPVVREADELALRIEAAHLKRSKGIEGAWPWRELPLSAEDAVVPCWTSIRARREFLKAHSESIA